MIFHVPVYHLGMGQFWLTSLLYPNTRPMCRLIAGPSGVMESREYIETGVTGSPRDLLAGAPIRNLLIQLNPLRFPILRHTVETAAERWSDLGPPSSYRWSRQGGFPGIPDSTTQERKK